MTLLLVPLARRVNNFSSVCNGNINSHGNIVYSVNTVRAETRKSGCVFKKLSRHCKQGKHRRCK